MQVASKVKDSLESTEFPKLAEGIEQIISGASLIGSSVDRKKLDDACSEFGIGMKQSGHLLQLGVKEVKGNRGTR